MWPQCGDTRRFTRFIVSLSSEMHQSSSQYFHIFPFSYFNSALTQRKCQGNKAAKCSLGKSSPFRVCISPNSQESLVEWDWSKVENRREDRLAKQKKKSRECQWAIVYSSKCHFGWEIIQGHHFPKPFLWFHLCITDIQESENHNINLGRSESKATTPHFV